MLQSIPAAAIEKIEIITSPSAKYDAQGQAVINIILKKGGKPGNYGSITVSAGTRDNYTAGASLSYRAGNAELYGNYSFQHRNTYSNGYQYMTYLHPDDSTYRSNEEFPSTTIRNVHNVQTGAGFRLSPADRLDVGFQYNGTTTGRREYLTVNNYTKQQTPTQLSNRANTTNGWNTSWGAAADLTHQFKKPAEELTIDFSWATSSGNSSQLYSTDIYNIDGQTVKPAPALFSDTKGAKSSDYNIQLDYTLPLGKEGLLEVGARSQLSLTNNRQWDANLDTLTGSFDADYSLINFFRANGQVHAVYVDYRKKLGTYTIRAGIRAEAGRFAATLQNYDSAGSLVNTPIGVNTNGLYPTISVIRQFRQAQQLQLSYTRRISRPTPAELDPVWDVSDPVNYDMGNPALRPENIHSVELTWKKSWTNITITSGLYYTLATDVIKHVQTDPVKDVTITISENLPRAINTGLELIANMRVSGLWSFTANINVYDRINSAAPPFGIPATSGVTWNANITNDLSLAKGLTVQVRADYKANEVILQDWWRRAYGLDAGAKYDFAHNRATLAFSSRDIFNTRRPAFFRVSDDLLLDWQRITYSARAALTFTWRFGAGGSEHKRPDRPDDQQDKRIENR